MSVRGWTLLAVGLLAWFLYSFLPSPGGPWHLDLDLQKHALIVDLDGMRRLDIKLDSYSNNKWQLEASPLQTADLGPVQASLRDIEVVSATTSAIEPGIGAGKVPSSNLPILLDPPCRVSMTWYAPEGGSLVLRSPGQELGVRVILDTSRNEIYFVQRLPGDCALQNQGLQPLVPTDFWYCWGQLVRKLLGFLAKASLGLGLLVLGASMLPVRPKGGRAARPIKVSGFVTAAAAILVFGLAVSLNLFVLQRIPKSFDEVMVLFQARILAQGRLAAPFPPLPRFFSAEGLYLNALGWTGKQALVWPWILAQALRIRLAWIVDPLVAAMCVWLLARLVALVDTAEVAMVAALGLALSPLFIEFSASYLNMVPAMAAALWLAYAFFCLKAKQDQGSQTLALLVPVILALVLLTSMRAYTGMALWFGACAWLWFENKAWRGRNTLLCLAGLAVIAAVLSFQNLLQTGNLFVSAYQNYNPNDRPGLGANVGLFWTWGSPGHDLSKVALNVELYIRLFADRLNGWGGGLFLASLVAAWTLRRRDSLDRLMVWLIAAQIFGYALYYSADPIHGPRYWVEIAGFVILLQARGVVALMDRLGERIGQLGFQLATVVVIGVAVWGLVGGLSQRIAILRDYSYVEGRLRRAVAQEPQTPSLVFFNNEDSKRYVEPFGMQDPWLQAPYVFARDQGSAEADQALVGYFPGRRVLYWDGRTLASERWGGCSLPL